MRPRCVELARVLKKTGSFYYHCDWHASALRQGDARSDFRGEQLSERNRLDSAQRRTADSKALRTRSRYSSSSTRGERRTYTSNRAIHAVRSDEYIYFNISTSDVELAEHCRDRRHYRARRSTVKRQTVDETNDLQVGGIRRHWGIDEENMKQMDAKAGGHLSEDWRCRRCKGYDEMQGVLIQNVWNDISDSSGRIENRATWVSTQSR